MSIEMKYFEDGAEKPEPKVETELPTSNTAHLSKKMDKLIRILAVVFITLIAITILLLVIFYFTQREPAKEVAAPSIVSTAMAPQAVAPSTPVPTPAPTPDLIPREEWYLKLVNRANPLPEGFDVETVAIDTAGYYLDARAADDFAALLDAATADSMKLKIASAYRSYEKQQQLYNAKVRELSSEMSAEQAAEKAQTLVAKPGESEHNLGLALDIVATYNQRMEEDYEQTPECQWLAREAWKYGFILRYPKDKQDATGVIYEPWHYRYVGREQAKLIYESGLCLEEYLSA